jgi:hypothetical protein
MPRTTTPVEDAVTEVVPRTERGRRRALRGMATLTPLEQIRAVPNSGTGTLTGAYAYYLNPTGATIRDALILYPNGGVPPNTVQNWRKYGANADLYRARQARKGLEFIGTTLTAEGVAKLVAVLQKNQPEEILDLEDQIAECTADIANSDRPEVRDNQRKRRAQLQQRLDYVRTPINVESLVAELNEIARAQRMSKVSPETLAVMREMMAEQSATFMASLEKFKSTTNPDADEAAGSY